MPSSGRSKTVLCGGFAARSVNSSASSRRHLLLHLPRRAAAGGKEGRLLKALFGSNQDMAPADYIQGSMMVRYNGMKCGTSF